MTANPDRAAALAHLATHLDLPPELMPDLPALTLMEAERHEPNARVDEACQEVCEELTRTWLRPALDAAGVPDAHEYRVTPTGLVEPEPYPAATQATELQTAVAELAQAIRLTRQYVGEDLLPAVEGWSWYDALRRHAPHQLPTDRDAEPETHVAADDSDDPEHTDDCPGCTTGATP